MTASDYAKVDKAKDIAGAYRWALQASGERDCQRAIVAGLPTTRWERMIQLAAALRVQRLMPPMTDAALESAPAKCTHPLLQKRANCGQHLEGNLGAAGGVHAAPHFAHAAASERFDELERPQASHRGSA